MSVDPVVDCFASAMRIVRETPFEAKPGEPDPSSYYGSLLSGDETVRAEATRKQIAYLRQIFEFAGLRSVDGLDVLEVGSGFGVGLIAIACLGARRARGIELVPWRAEWAGRCAQALPPELGDRIDNEIGSATNMPQTSESVDVLLSLEAISHYLDYRPFLSEAWRVLRTGGTLIISDGNNSLNPLIRRHRVALWGEHESPPGARRTREPDYPFHFVDKRQAIIEQAHPDLPGELTLELALATSGMVQNEVLWAARRYIEDGVLPNQRYRRGQLSVHPTHGLVMERLFNPFRLARELEREGFRTKVRGHWAGATRRRSLRFADKALAAVTPVSIVTARAFRIAAHKSSS